VGLLTPTGFLFVNTDRSVCPHRSQHPETRLRMKCRNRPGQGDWSPLPGWRRGLNIAPARREGKLRFLKRFCGDWLVMCVGVGRIVLSNLAIRDRGSKNSTTLVASYPALTFLQTSFVLVLTRDFIFLLGRLR
jgi:hypothetical protein